MENIILTNSWYYVADTKTSLYEVNIPPEVSDAIFFLFN